MTSITDLATSAAKRSNWSWSLRRSHCRRQWREPGNGVGGLRRRRPRDGRAVFRVEGTARWFYIINAEDDDEARAWARRVAEATNHSIEVRPFAATGLVKDLAM